MGRLILEKFTKRQDQILAKEGGGKCGKHRVSTGPCDATQSRADLPVPLSRDLWESKVPLETTS